MKNSLNTWNPTKKNRRNENKNSSQKMHIKQIEQQTDEKKKQNNNIKNLKKTEQKKLKIKIVKYLDRRIKTTSFPFGENYAIHKENPKIFFKLRRINIIHQ